VPLPSAVSDIMHISMEVLLDGKMEKQPSLLLLLLRHHD
jgi:hypothetical protein